MNSTWLQIRSNAADLPGPFLQEYRNLYQEHRGVYRMVVEIEAHEKRDKDVIPLGDNARYGIRLKRLDNSTVIADCNIHISHSPERIRGGPIPGYLTLHQLYSLSKQTPIQIANRLYGEVIFPLSSIIILPIDGFKSLAEAANILANWMRFSPLLDIKPPPRLLIYTRNIGLTIEHFCNQTTLEMIEILRKENPESSYTYAQAREAWVCHIESVRILTNQNWSLITTSLDEISKLRKQYNCGFSALHFQQLLQQAIISFALQDGKPLDMLRILGIQDPTTGYARTYLQEFLKEPLDKYIDCIPVIASSLAMNTYTSTSHSM